MVFKPRTRGVIPWIIMVLVSYRCYAGGIHLWNEGFENFKYVEPVDPKLYPLTMHIQNARDNYDKGMKEVAVEDLKYAQKIAVLEDKKEIFTLAEKTIDAINYARIGSGSINFVLSWRELMNKAMIEVRGAGFLLKSEPIK